RRALPAGVCRLRRRRAGSRARRRDRAGRALDPHAARHRGDRRSGRPAARHRAPTRMTVAAEPHPWHVPPRWVLLVAVLSIVCAEVGGASMARFKVELTRWARDAMLARPAVHGLVRVRDVDGGIPDEWLVWIPFGSATIVALWWLTGLIAVRMLRP